MNAKGLLDRFPIHLFYAGGTGSSVLIVDAPDLGRLQIAPAGGGQPKLVVIASDDPGLLGRASPVRVLYPECVCFLRASPDRLPFRKNAFDVVLLTAGRSNGGLVAGSRLVEYARSAKSLLKKGGRTICIEDVRLAEAIRGGHPPQARQCFIRPASGRHYWASGTWLPRPWPFRKLQLGLTESIRLKWNLVRSSIGSKRLQDGVRVTIESGAPDFQAERARTDMAGGRRNPFEESPEGIRLYVKPDWQAFLLKPEDRGELRAASIVKFPLSKTTLRAMDRGLRQLAQLYGSIGSELRGFLPQVLECGSMAGQAYWEERLSPGVPATKFPRRTRWRRSAIEAGSEFIRKLHVETKRMTEIDDGLIVEMVGPQIQQIEKAVHLVDRDFELGPLYGAIRSGLNGRTVNLVRGHGDFWQGNILITESGALSSVLDWEQSKAVAWPLLDLLHLIVHQRKHRATWFFGDIVVERLIPKNFSRWESGLVGGYCRALEIADEMWPFWVTLYWLDRVSYWTQTDFGDPDVLKGSDAWIRRNIIAPLPYLLRGLERSADAARRGSRATS